MKLQTTFVLLICSAATNCSLTSLLTKQVTKDSDSIPVSYLAGTDCPDCLLTVGNTVGMFRFDTKQWCFGKPAPFNITEHTAATLGGNSYIISGYGSVNKVPPQNSNYLTAVQIYNPTTDSYLAGPDVHTARQMSSAVVSGDKIYIVDGLIAVSVNCYTTEIFDGHSWTFGPNTIYPRAAHVLVAAGNYLWLIGGFMPDPFNYFDSVEYLNLNSISDGWQWGPSMNNKRGYLGGVAINNTIYACGGWNNGEQFANCETLIINSDGSPMPGQAWSVSTSAMQQPRVDFTLVTYNNKAYTIGGYWPNIVGSTNNNATNVEEYDPVTDSWSVYYQALATGPFPNTCTGCRATVMYVTENDLTC